MTSAGSVGQTEEAIRDGRAVPYDSRFARASVSVGGYTGTIIGPRHVITAALCNIRAGRDGSIYRGSTPSGDTALVSRVYQPNGVSSRRFADVNGKFADYHGALPRSIDPLLRQRPRGSRWLAWNNVPRPGWSGQHKGVANPSKTLHYRYSYSYAASNAEGHILMEAATDPGRRGRRYLHDQRSRYPALHARRRLGPTSSSGLSRAGSATSTSAYHFPKIAYAIGNVQPASGLGLPRQRTIDRADGALLNGCIAALPRRHRAATAYTWVTDAPNQRGTCFWKSSIGAGGNGASGTVSGYRA